MAIHLKTHLHWLSVTLCLGTCTSPTCLADVPLGGFNSLVGMGLTNQFKSELDATFFLADRKDYELDAMMGDFALGQGGAYYELALLDSGSAVHILTPQAHVNFNINGAGFNGTQQQQIGGATGLLLADISDPLGVFAGGLSNRTIDSPLDMNTSAMRGQTSAAILSAPSEWTLPSLVGMPIVSQYATVIRNDQPQIFQHNGRTVRSPNVEFDDLGSGGHGIVRRTSLKIRPGTSFIQPPLYVFNPENILLFQPLTEDPSSPTVVENGGFFVDVDLNHGANEIIDMEVFFDTGFDVTVLSPITAARLGHDILIDEPDFIVQAEGPGGIGTNIPGFYLDQLTIPAIGGFFTATNVPVLVLEVPNVSDPGNVMDAVIGSNLFVGRNLVIDPNPAIGQGGPGPSLYIGDPVTQAHQWSNAAASGNWSTAGNWTAPGTPDVMWVAEVGNVSGSNQEAVVTADSTVNRVKVSGTASGMMTVRIDSGASLTVFGDVNVSEHGRIELNGGRLDAQLVQLDGGTLAGNGEVFIGNGPVINAVQNLSGTIAPGDPIGLLTIDGDLSSSSGGTLAIDLGGTMPVSLHDQLDVTRFAFLAGTLDVSLDGPYTPEVGHSFTILTTGEGVSGEFDHLLFPPGFLWDVSYGPNDVVLEVIGLGLMGDYNHDWTVNAADYTVWRNTLGSTTVLDADGNNSGGIDYGDYTIWKDNYGNTIPGGAAGGAFATTPEPGSVALAIVAALAAFATTRLRFGSARYSARSVRSVDVLWSVVAEVNRGTIRPF